MIGFSYNSRVKLLSVAVVAIIALLSSGIFKTQAAPTGNEEDQAALESMLAPDDVADDREGAESDLNNFLNESPDPEDSDSDADDDTVAASNLMPVSNANSKPYNLGDDGEELIAAAGHHYHKKHKHYVSGKLEMGAETGKKGAFKWHDKHPVGGKGRR